MANNLVLVGGAWVVQQSNDLTSSAQALSPIFWGTGIDGALTTVGTYTQTYSLNLSSLTIPSGTVFKPAGYPTFVSGTTTINAGGSYNDNGLDASGVTAGAALTQRNPLDARSGVGGGGRTNADGAGLIGGAATASRTSRNSLGVQGRGGAGGAAPPGYGISSTAASVGTQILQFQNWPTTVFPSDAGGWTGSPGGSGGSMDYDGVNVGTSGAGGSGGGIVWLVTKFLVNNGTISCNGGNGSNGTSAGGATTTGGGGGGMGGFVMVTTTSTVTGSITANGGLGGLGANGGGTGSVGDIGNTVVHIYS